MGNQKEILVHVLIKEIDPGSYRIEDLCDKICTKYPDFDEGKIKAALQSMPEIFKLINHYPVVMRRSHHL